MFSCLSDLNQVFVHGSVRTDQKEDPFSLSSFCCPDRGLLAASELADFFQAHLASSIFGSRN